MSYSASKVDKIVRDGQAHVSVVYSAQGQASITETYRTATIYSGWPDDIINNRLDELNGLDISQIALGPPAARKQPDPPTQDQLDLQAFQLATQNYLTIYATVNGAAASKISTKLTQQDVLDAYSAWKQTVLSDTYLALLPKDFPYQ